MRGEEKGERRKEKGERREPINHTFLSRAKIVPINLDTIELLLKKFRV